MKIGLLSLLLFSSLCANAQSDTFAIEIAVPPDSTELGVSNGKSNSKEIGPSGGTIVSEDGKIELIFPAGALSKMHTIQIQPTTNHAPNGAGKSYWFEPSGIQFKQPVQIFFHYTDEDAETCPPDLMCLGIQSKNGKWSFVEYEEIDTISKTLKGLILHFSGGSNVFKLKLVAEKNQLRVNETTEVRLSKYLKGYEFKTDAIIRMGRPVLWYVNGFENGNAAVGSIYPGIMSYPKSKESVHTAYYVTPNFLVSKNPVTISAELYAATGNKKVYERSAKLSCKIHIYDVYQITVNYTVDFPGANDHALTDTSSFFVWVYPDRIVIDNIKNYAPYISKSGTGPCKIVISTKGYNGYVHLKEGYMNYKLSKDNPPEVLFQFLPMYETSLFEYQWFCKKVPPSPLEVAYGIPLSPEINFIANGQKQIINYHRYETKYKITVVPYRPEIPK